MSKMQGQISSQIKDEMIRQDISLRQLAELTSMDHGNLSRLLSGKRPWQMDHLERVAPALGLTITDLVSDFIEVPVKARLTKKGFKYTDIVDPAVILGTVAIPRPHGAGKTAEMIAKCYGVELQRDDIIPFPSGTILVAAHDSSEQLKNGDMVFYPAENGSGWLGRITLNHDIITLTPLVPGHEALTLPRIYLSLCDKVIMARFL